MTTKWRTQPITTHITVQCDDGDVEATRPSHGGFWDISYPWGAAERFAGTPAKVRARIKRTVKKHEESKQC